jgi:DNA-binding MarR family transcriptional regulator
VHPNELERAAIVRRAVMLLGRRLQAERRPDGLSLTKISVLGHLSRRGELTPGELAAADRLQPQSLTRVLTELAADGLITAVRGVADGRQRRLRITDQGRAALAQDMGERDEWLVDAMEAQLSGTESDLLVLASALLERLALHSGPSGSDTFAAGLSAERRRSRTAISRSPRRHS